VLGVHARIEREGLHLQVAGDHQLAAGALLDQLADPAARVVPVVRSPAQVAPTAMTSTRETAA
jgi:hypothetical protein